MGRIITGFIEGVVRHNTNGEPEILPFQDKIEGVTFTWQSENTIVETFSANGIKGASEACPFREMATIEFMSKNLAWSFLQAATGYLDQAATDPVPRTYSVVLSASSGSPAASTLTLPSTPSAGLDIVVADENGTQYPVTATGANLTFESDLTGTKVTVNYFETPAVGQREIALGAGTRLGEISVYGQFFGCPGGILLVANRGVIRSNLEFGIETDAAQAALTIDLLRDPDGAFAYLQLD